MSAGDDQILEDALVSRRAYDLSRGRIEGAYDAEHLKAFHRFLFQDCPGEGLHHLSPGEFRGPVAEGRHWYKIRALTTNPLALPVVYSPMDAEATSRRDQALSLVHPDRLRGLGAQAFSGALAELYAEAEYVHRFAKETVARCAPLPRSSRRMPGSVCNGLA